MLLLALVVIPASAADSPSLTGKWKVHNSIVGNESDQVCLFALTGKKISGNLFPRPGLSKVTGQISDATITWQYNTEYNGSPLTLVYTGTMGNDSKITGTVEVQPMSINGDFIATPSN